MRRTVILTVAVVAVAGLVQPVAAVAASSAMVQAFADAGRRAQQSGLSVEVREETTATRRVVANPNGTYTLTANRRVSLDQTNALARSHWAEVTSVGGQAYDAARDARVGSCGTPGCYYPGNPFVARSYFEFDVSPLWSSDGRVAAITRASFLATQTWTSDRNCFPQPTAVYESGGIYQGMSWPGASGAWLDTEHGTGGNGCPVGTLSFDVWWGVRHAADSHRSVVLGLAADNESNQSQWKRFDSNPALEVDFFIPGIPAVPVPPQSTLDCAASASVYTVHSAGGIGLTQHLEPETGANSWSAQQQIGSFGADAKRLAGPNGAVYSLINNGELRRRRWNGTGWDTFAGGAQYEVIDTNPLWARYVSPANFNRITVDASGDFYTVEEDGNLHWRNYNPTTRAWAHRVVDRGWALYDTIVAAGSGVLYARGRFHAEIDRYRYHAASQRLEYDGGHMPGVVDWRIFKRIFSAGGDILYGVTSAGDMRWYRYNENTNTWASGSDRVVSTGWQNEYETFAAPDACRRAGTPAPTRPSVTPRPQAPVTLFESSNDHLHYSYVDSEGRAVYAEAADLSGGTPIRLAAVPGFTNLTGVTSLAEHWNYGIQLAGTGLDAEVWSNTRTNGSWGATTSLGGFATNPVILSKFYAYWPDHDETVAAFTVDQDGLVRYNTEIGIAGPSTAWKCIGHYAGPGTPRLGTDPLIFVRDFSWRYFRLIARDRNGTITMRRLSSLSARGCDSMFDGPQGRASGIWWDNLGSGYGQPSVAIKPFDNVHLFATKDGTVYLYRERWGSWTPVSSGITAAGTPSAILAPDGLLKVVVRATDGFIYYSSETTAGSDTFTPWQEISGFTDEAGTDPTALAYGNTWVVAYRTDLEVPRLRRYQPPTLAASSIFVNVPIEAMSPFGR